MELKRLDPSLRKNLKDLLEGYLEHCQVSRHLMARIDFPIYYHGFKFGAPIFTHSSSVEGSEVDRVIGLLGGNTPHSELPSEILLQLIEILVQQPEISDGSALRILPVANPVALELGEHAPDIADWPILEHLIENFRDQSTDGFLELSVTSGEYLLEGKATAALFSALERVTSEVDHDSPRPRVLAPENIRLTPIAAGQRWHLKLSVPENWTGAPEIHALARFLSRLIRVHSQAHQKDGQLRNG